MLIPMPPTFYCKIVGQVTNPSSCGLFHHENSLCKIKYLADPLSAPGLLYSSVSGGQQAMRYSKLLYILLAVISAHLCFSRYFANSESIELQSVEKPGRTTILGKATPDKK